MDGHVKNFTTWVASADFFNTLTAEQQEIFVSAGEEAGIYNNEVQAAAESEYMKKMVAEGVTVTEVTEENMAKFKEASKSFYELGSKFGWSEGLFETVQAAMGN